MQTMHKGLDLSRQGGQLAFGTLLELVCGPVVFSGTQRRQEETRIRHDLAALDLARLLVMLVEPI